MNAIRLSALAHMDARSANMSCLLKHKIEIVIQHTLIEYHAIFFHSIKPIDYYLANNFHKQKDNKMVQNVN